VLQASKRVDAQTRYARVQLKETPKDEVLAWKPGQALRREAFLVVKQGPQTFEAIVDVSAKQLVSWKEIKGVQPSFGGAEEEEDGIDTALKENPDFQAGLKRRGITDYGTVACDGYGMGYFGTAEGMGGDCFGWSALICAAPSRGYPSRLRA
jgi:primary-amine oxidase